MGLSIEAGTSVEELVTLFPAAVSIMLEQNLAPLVCGEPVWGTVEELAKAHGWREQDIRSLLAELKRAYAEATHQ